jgi:replicative DNA helicase
MQSFKTDHNEQISVESIPKILTSATAVLATERKDPTKGQETGLMAVGSLLQNDEQTNIDVLNAAMGVQKNTCPQNLILNHQAVLAEFMANKKRYEKKDKMVTGVSTGYVELDKMTAGFQPSDLIILAGRPSMGKTAFAMNIAQHMALFDNVGVGIFSLELSSELLIKRLFSSMSRVDPQKIYSGWLFPEDLAKLFTSLDILKKAPIYIDDSPGITAQEIKAKVSRLAVRHKIGLIIVDYLQLMLGTTTNGNRSQEIRGILKDLKAIAKEFEIPVLVLSQLTQNLECRQDKHPVMSDLPESEAVEQEADVICFIYRDEIYNKAVDNPENGSAEIIIGKQRNGQTGTCRLTFRRECMLFENASCYDEPTKW